MHGPEDWTKQPPTRSLPFTTARRVQYRDLVQARSKGSAGKHKAPNAVEQQKARDKEIKAALKEQKASSAAKKHDEDEARKRTIKEERCARPAPQLRCV